MRRFYVFNIREELMILYKDNQDNLYKILNSIYTMKDTNFVYAYNLFKQICLGIDILTINNKIYLKMHNDLVYSKIENEHIINNLYKNEVSILKVKRSHLIIDCNNSYTSFFNLLNSLNKNFFICDFRTGDFFFLRNIELIVE